MQQEGEQGSTQSEEVPQVVQHSDLAQSTQPDRTTYLEAPLIQDIPIPVQAQSERNSATRIMPSGKQFGRAEKNIAKFLDQAGLSDVIFNVPEPEREFHLRIENEPYLPLVVERHDDRLYLTHYREVNFDLIHDGEIVFELSDTGHLNLRETAVQNPFTGGESRRLDKNFGATFAQNILAQGFAEAAHEAWIQKQTTQEASAVPAEILEQADAQAIEASTIEAGVLSEVKDQSISVSLVNEVKAALDRPDEELAASGSKPPFDSSLQELQEKYPQYTFEVSQFGVSRHKDTVLLIRDLDNSSVGNVNVTQLGSRLAYENADELIQRHEEKLQRPEFVALREEFPDLRFEDTVNHAGRVRHCIYQRIR